MGKISTLIVDDEPLARERLRGLLKTEPMIEVVGECANGLEALAAIDTAGPDLLFLDMQMPGCDGLQVLARLPAEQRPAVIFSTAHEKFAVDAFNIEAVDFLLKPYDRERLQQALRRAQEHLHTRRGAPAGPGQAPAPRADRLAFKTESRIVFVTTKEIIWVQANDNYVMLHLANGRLLLRETMAAIETRLGVENFVRIHRSAIVQTAQVKELQPALHGDYTVVLHDGTKLPLSRSMRGPLVQMMGVGQ